MTFVVMGLGTVFNALTNRRDPASGLAPPLLKALAISLVPLAMIVLATELPGLQKGLLTVSLTGTQWLACLGLAALLPLVIETGKWIRRQAHGRPPRRSTRSARSARPGRSSALDVSSGPDRPARSRSRRSSPRRPGPRRTEAPVSGHAARRPGRSPSAAPRRADGARTSARSGRRAARR